MNTESSLYESHLTSVRKIGQGKVRDIYEADKTHLIIVACDRVSAFDVILPDPIPAKGRLLTEISLFWFNKLKYIVPNHLSDQSLSEFLTKSELEQIDGRGMLVKKLTPLPFEAVVRGYLAGSGWLEYRQTQSICGIKLPENLTLAQQLEQAIFTPATKAAVGDHDENINFKQLCDLVGEKYAQQAKDLSIRIYQEASLYAKSKGIIIADTKFEFGLDEEQNLVLIDEVLTPDSSRFWPCDQYHTGISPPSFDKQFIRDYLETLDWDKCAPGPRLPKNIIDKTADKYQEAVKRLSAK